MGTLASLGQLWGWGWGVAIRGRWKRGWKRRGKEGMDQRLGFGVETEERWEFFVEIWAHQVQSTWGSFGGGGGGGGDYTRKVEERLE